MTRVTHSSRSVSLTVLAAAMLFVSGCGGGGTGAASTPADTQGTNTQGTISGNVVKGPLSGATVTAYAVNKGVMGMALASATTDAQGAFTVSVGSYAGPVMLQASGGTYAEEATGASVGMGSGDVLNVALPTMMAGTAISGVQMTPLTSMAQAMARQHMAGGLVDANITTANAAVGAYFMVGDIVYTHPMNPLVAGSGTGATPAMANYGMTLAAMSQYAKNAGIPATSALVTAMMADASDGTLDGKAGGTQITMGGMMGGGMMQPDAGTSGLATAMADFAGSGLNKSGLTSANVASLMQQLMSSTGMIH